MTLIPTHEIPPLQHWLRDALHPLSDAGAWNRLLGRVDPLWSVTGIRARVVERVTESADTISLWLKPNRRWRGHAPGQHITLGVEIDGVRRRRVFSVSTAARPDRLLRITLQRQAEGGVTEWLHEHAKKGLVVEISEASGEFVLPAPAPDRLLMIAGGSGITPLLAMLQRLADDACTTDIVLFQLYRHPDQRLFAGELADISRRLPGFSVHAHCSAERGRLIANDLASSVPDLDMRQTLLCGPEHLMQDVAAAWAGRGLEDQLQTERFGAPRPAGGAGSGTLVRALGSEQVFTQVAGHTLLESAETAGLQPKFGCRAGLCRTCLCQKRSGRVRNLLTGLVSSQPDEWVQLCVAVAESDLELVL
jgi:ferredoxin-NADP reductase